MHQLWRSFLTGATSVARVFTSLAEPAAPLQPGMTTRFPLRLAWNDYVARDMLLRLLSQADAGVIIGNNASYCLLVDTFTQSRFIRDKHVTHDAVDILAPRGTPVTPLVGGYVIASGFSSYGGHHALVATPLPGNTGVLSHYYAHMTGRCVRAGDTVTQDMVLGFVDNTGGSEAATLKNPRHAGPPHLHLQTYLYPALVCPQGSECPSFSGVESHLRKTRAKRELLNPFDLLQRLSFPIDPVTRAKFTKIPSISGSRLDITAVKTQAVRIDPANSSLFALRALHAAQYYLSKG